jgi:hypothetical protein
VALESPSCGVNIHYVPFLEPHLDPLLGRLTDVKRRVSKPSVAKRRGARHLGLTHLPTCRTVLRSWVVSWSFASIAALVSATGVIDVSWRLLGSLALTAIGAVAVVGSVNGRPPGLHGAGFALMIALVVVIVPLGVDGSLDTRAGFGAVTLFDQRAMGASIERRFISGSYETMERRVHVVARVGIGSVQVRQEQDS